MRSSVRERGLATITWLAVLAALIGIITLIVWPVVACASPNTSNRTACMSHLKQIAMSLQFYASDNDDRFPPAQRWMDAANLEAKNDRIFKCPALEGSDGFGYAMLSKMGLAKVARIKDPASQALVFDSHTTTWNAVSSVVNAPNPPRHQRNVTAYADGHAKILP